MIKEIFFRFEINKHIGTGHAIRCLRIAEFFYNKKYKVNIIISNKSFVYLKKLNFKTLSNYNILKIKASSSIRKDAEDTKKLLSKCKRDSEILIFKDSYKLDLNWDRIIRKKYSNLIILDDFLNKKHNCKIYINFNPYKINQLKYKNKNTKYLVGLKYFPYNKKILKKKKIKKCLIYFGGSDKKSLTLKITKILVKINIRNIKFIILIGEFNKDRDKIKKIATTNYQIIDKHVNIHKILNTSMFMIGTGGTTLWEALINEIYPLIIPSHSNHIWPCEYLKRINKIELIKNIVTNDSINKKIIKNYFLNKNKTKNSNFIDDKGLSRIYNLINE